MKKFDIIIIGAGPAGMMAAHKAQNKDKSILLIEKNEKTGKKLYITGKGRCNVTNNADISEFIDIINVNPYFLYSALYSFSNRDLIDFLADNGLETKVERGQRVFPKSDKSSDVIKALEKSCKKVQINLNENVEDVSKNTKGFQIKSDKDTYHCDKLIIATGGITYRATGSTGDGYRFAKNMDHSIIRARGSLLPIELGLDQLESVSGLTVKNSKISLYLNDKKQEDIFGDFLLTHKGASGPIILTLSDKLVDLDPNRVKLYCDFKPAISHKELDMRLLKDIDKSPKILVKTLLDEYFPKNLARFLLLNSQVDENKRLSDLTREDRKAILTLMKSFNLNYKKTLDDNLGIITKGGVNTKEIDPSTMESKLCPGLYFAGELIDVSGPTGGFNLQIAFSTGYLAGKSASE